MSFASILLATAFAHFSSTLAVWLLTAAVTVSQHIASTVDIYNSKDFPSGILVRSSSVNPMQIRLNTCREKSVVTNFKDDPGRHIELTNRVLLSGSNMYWGPATCVYTSNNDLRTMSRSGSRTKRRW